MPTGVIGGLADTRAGAEYQMYASVFRPLADAIDGRREGPYERVRKALPGGLVAC